MRASFVCEASMDLELRNQGQLHFVEGWISDQVLSYASVRSY